LWISGKTALWFWAALLLANVVDVAATHYALSLGCAEANPAVDFVYWRFGVAGLLGWKGACLLLLARFLPSIRGWTKSLLGASAFFCLAVAVYHCAGIAATL
jgi:hypothetical protein